MEKSKKEVQTYFTEAVAFMEKKIGKRNIFLRRRPHGRKDAASASLLYAHYRGWTVIRERDIRQPGAAVPMAGRVSRPHEKAFPVLKLRRAPL